MNGFVRWIGVFGAESEKLKSVCCVYVDESAVSVKNCGKEERQR